MATNLQMRKEFNYSSRFLANCSNCVDLSNIPIFYGFEKHCGNVNKGNFKAKKREGVFEADQ